MKPEQVLLNWDVPSLADTTTYTLKRASSGLLNKTFIIRAGSNGQELYILQCVNPAVSMAGTMSNYFHVTQFLKDQGLPTQVMLRTKDDNLWIEDGADWRWRLLIGVEGEVYEKTTNPLLAEEAGRLLGQFHAVLSQYPREVEKGRISAKTGREAVPFNYEEEIERLNQYQAQLMADPDESIRNATQLLISELPKLMLPGDLPEIIIHADPKISNFLFTDDWKGVCLIDLDTIQKLSPLYDIGDALRSWCGQYEDDPENSFNEIIYKSFLQGYTSKGLLSPREQALIPQATKLVMLGLATRFMNDYIEDFYFGWDETRYNNRKTHNKARAMGQISLYQTALKSL